MSDQIRIYRPSNGTECDSFMDRFCFQCAKANFDEESDRQPCQIVGRVLGGIAGDDPDEWRYLQDGSPTCTAFKHEDDNNPDTYRCPETPDMFL